MAQKQVCPSVFVSAKRIAYRKLKTSDSLAGLFVVPVARLDEVLLLFLPLPVEKKIIPELALFSLVLIYSLPNYLLNSFCIHTHTQN